MKKGWKIALIVVGAFLAICGVFLFSGILYKTRHTARVLTPLVIGSESRMIPMTVGRICRTA